MKWSNVGGGVYESGVWTISKGIGLNSGKWFIYKNNEYYGLAYSLKAAKAKII